MALVESFIGTSGYSYPEWKGEFYPDRIATSDMLSFYASQLSSVEVNNTFYRMPRASVLSNWAKRVSPGFRFAVKASRRITHFKRLADCEQVLSYLLGGLSNLGPHLGPILFQLPPTLKADTPRLAAFVEMLPPAIEPKTDRSAKAGAVSALCQQSAPLLAAFEFRHRSWFCDSVYEVLAQRGCALVGGDQDEEGKDPPLVRTAAFSYLRLRKTHYQSAELSAWARRLRDAGFEQNFAYFKHEELGPKLARRLQNLL